MKFGIVRVHRVICLALLSLVITSAAEIDAWGAAFQTENFQVDAESTRVARLVAETAEAAREQIAIDWTGKELSAWNFPCRLQVTVVDRSARGLTSYEMKDGRYGDWTIEVSGPLDELVDSVIPHEVSHTIIAGLFSHPLPRWVDEGTAMMCESPAERKRQHLIASELVKAENRIPLRQLISLREYPPDASQMMAIYCLGYSLSDYLVQIAGRNQYLKLLAEAERIGWERALFQLYGYETIESLERAWIDWVSRGHPALKRRLGWKWI